MCDCDLDSLGGGIRGLFLPQLGIGVVILKKKMHTILSGDDGSITKWGVLGTMGQFESAQNYHQQSKLLLDATVGFD